VVNSFMLNRRWTFGRCDRSTASEIRRFIATTLGGIALNDALLWLLSMAMLPVLGPTQLWANTAKIGQISWLLALAHVGALATGWGSGQPGGCARCHSTLGSGGHQDRPGRRRTSRRIRRRWFCGACGR
jgi:hypothetical protein